jgi:hypothetical protein
MKKLIVILVALLIAAAAFVYTDPQLRQDATNAVKRFIGKSAPTSGSTVIYKWTDDNGVVQYTSEPPPKGTPYEEVEAQHDVNVLPLPDKLKNK